MTNYFKNAVKNLRSKEKRKALRQIMNDSFQNTEKTNAHAKRAEDIIQQEATLGLSTPLESNSEVGILYQKLLEHPLAKRFLDMPPAIYVVKKEELKAFGQNENLHNVVTLGERTILVTEAALQDCTPEEAISHIAHELAHLMCKDSLKASERKANQQMERRADKIAIMLTRNPEARKNAIIKNHAANLASVAAITANQGRFSQALMRKINKHNIDYGTRQYPGEDARLRAIDAFAAKLDDPLQKDQTEAELIREIEKLRAEVASRSSAATHSR